ncbi:MAG: thioredoxin fold domain-containing protein [Pyrinomonadaceae bacterium]|nr:thioredoxin fold domain-containing protein [Pyrinomonadaceae bacterium]
MIDALILCACVFLFLVFSIASVGKLSDIQGGKKSLKQMGFSEKHASVLVFILPILEIIIAIGFLIKDFIWLSSVASTALLLGFIGFVYYQIKKGSSTECHCFGAIHSEPISPKVILRNFLFLVPSVFLLFQYERLQIFNPFEISFDLSLQVIFGSVVIVLLTLVSFYLKENIKKQNEILRRLEILSLVTKEDETEERNLRNPTEGLPIGAPIPEFKAKNEKGEIVASSSVFQKPSILIFTSPNCELCNLLLPEIKSWQEKMKERFDFIVVSNGSTKEISEKFNKFLIQEDHEISNAFKTRWTPTAILINRNARIASAPAAGDKAIRAMVEYLNLNGEVEFIPEGKEEKDGKIGSVIPDFSLEDLDGNPFHSRQFIGRKTILVYWSPTCGFCKEMLEELREWEKKRKPYDPALVVLTASPDIGKNRDLRLQAPILIDKNREVSEMLGMKGTPSAILIDENARIISQIAIGAEQIWALLGRSDL